MAWTDEQVQRLRELWDEGRSPSQIAAILGGGITRNAVIGKAHRLDLPPRDPPPYKPRPITRPKPTTTTGKGRDTVPLNGVVGNDLCLWPVGNPGDPHFHFCGEPALEARPYCAEHCQLGRTMGGGHHPG